jgi:hypothetical protein
MRRIGLALALAALWGLGACGGGRVSGEVGRACVAAGRSAASPQLCSCVQGVADQTLSASEQRLAAQFFEDPDLAQRTRTSNDPRTERFWERYRAFADYAAAVCG